MPQKEKSKGSKNEWERGTDHGEKTVIHSYLNSCVISVQHRGASLSFDTQPQSF